MCALVHLHKLVIQPGSDNALVSTNRKWCAYRLQTHVHEQLCNKMERCSEWIILAILTEVLFHFKAPSYLLKAIGDHELCRRIFILNRSKLLMSSVSTVYFLSRCFSITNATWLFELKPWT